MILWNLSLLFEQPLIFLRLISLITIALLVAITFHEFSHALAAHSLGDSTAARLGRLSLNPLRHLDPLGTVMIFAAGFGWGKPVPVNPYYLRNGMKAGMAMVSAAGPLANLATAALFALPIKARLIAWHPPFQLYPARLDIMWLAADILGYVIFLSIILAIFNLVPIAPLDGFKVAVGVLPRELSDWWAKTERYGPMILLLVIAFSFVTPYNILWGVLNPIVKGLIFLFVGRGL